MFEKKSYRNCNKHLSLVTVYQNFKLYCQFCLFTELNLNQHGPSII